MKGNAKTRRPNGSVTFSLFLGLLGTLCLGIGGWLFATSEEQLTLFERFECNGPILSDGYQSDATIETLDSEVVLTFDELGQHLTSPMLEGTGIILAEFLFVQSTVTAEVISDHPMLFEVVWVGSIERIDGIQVIQLGIPVSIEIAVNGPVTMHLIATNFLQNQGIPLHISLKSIHFYH